MVVVVVIEIRRMMILIPLMLRWRMNQACMFRHVNVVKMKMKITIESQQNVLEPPLRSPRRNNIHPYYYYNTTTTTNRLLYPNDHIRIILKPKHHYSYHSCHRHHHPSCIRIIPTIITNPFIHIFRYRMNRWDGRLNLYY